MQPIEIQEPVKKQIAIGIDLGTTNSLVACDEGSKVKVIGELVPSIVSYDNGKFAVGEKAKNLKNTIRSIKRLMGRGLYDIGDYANLYPIDKDYKEGMVRLKLDEKILTPIEISSEILKVLKTRAEEYLGNKVSKAVITVPAYFDDAARTATRDAAKLAGLEVLRLVNEPTAAALAYGLDKEVEGIYAVYDLGGGTFDFSLLKMEKGVFQVLATGGDTALGGDDIDLKIAKYFSKNITQELMNIAKEAKEFLTYQSNWKKDAYKLSREELDKLSDEMISYTIEISKDVIRQTKLDIKHINGVVLVGGATRMPIVRKKVKEFIGKEPLTDIDPDKVVAVGAAIQARALTEGSEMLLLDVIPLSLGIETYGGLAERIIERNTPIPISKSQEFTTYQDNQTGMQIHIVQGEREMVKDLRSLAHFELTAIPPMKAGAARVEINFSVDADGVLTVSAKEKTTGTSQKITVKPSYGLTDREIEKMLYDNMVHAREDIVERLLSESRIEAKRNIMMIETFMREEAGLFKPEEIKEIERQIEIINGLIERTDREGIDQAVRDLDRICIPFAERRMNQAVESMIVGKNIKVAEQISNH